MAISTTLQIGEPVCIVPAGDACGEGILWDAPSRSIYWTDINRFLVHRYALANQTVRTWIFDEPVTCVLATESPALLVLVLGSGAVLWQPETGGRGERIWDLPGWPRVRCNDAAIDPNGNLWVGTMRNNAGADGEPQPAGGFDGILYRIGGDKGVSEWRREIQIGNTLAWSPDASRFYFGDSLQNRIRSYEYDIRDSSIRGESPFFEGFTRGVPDGSAMDSRGYLWNCRYGGSCIVRIAQDGGVDRVIEMPVRNPTNCTFGGDSNNILYVTSASLDCDRWERFGGGLFAIETNVTGRPDFQFRRGS